MIFKVDDKVLFTGAENNPAQGYQGVIDTTTTAGTVRVRWDNGIVHFFKTYHHAHAQQFLKKGSLRQGSFEVGDIVRFNGPNRCCISQKTGKVTAVAHGVVIIRWDVEDVNVREYSLKWAKCYIDNVTVDDAKRAAEISKKVIAEEVQRTGKFVVWCPQSDKPITTRYETYEQAVAVSRSMARRDTEKTFEVLEVKAVSQVGVVTETK